MKASNGEWKSRLNGKISPALASEIDIFDNEVALKKQGKIEDRIFAETRLRRGSYGQRYDNGQRHDGTESRALAYDTSKPTKGVSTVWDAPGMQRIKVPFGGRRRSAAAACGSGSCGRESYHRTGRGSARRYFGPPGPRQCDPAW